MTYKRFVSVVLLAALAVLVLQPARAEALDPGTVLLIVGAAAGLVAVVAVVIIGNVLERAPRSRAAQAPPEPQQVAFQAESRESP